MTVKFKIIKTNMKQLSILILAASIATTTQAQKKENYFSIIKNGKSTEQFQSHVRGLLSQQSQQHVAKPTAIGHRLKAAVTNDASNTIMDTTLLKYSGTNGSTYDFNYMKYQTGYSSFGFSPNLFPYDYSSVSIKSDSVWNWTFDGTGFTISNINAASHNSNGTFNFIEDFYFNAGAPDGSDKYMNVLDGQGRQSQMYYLENTTGSYDSTGKMLVTYDNNNRVIADSIYDYNAGDWESSGLIRFTYDVSGNLDSFMLMQDAAPNGWQPVVVYKHYFDNSKRLIKVVGFQDLGVGLQPVVMDTFEYTGNLNFFSKLSEFTVDPNTGLMSPNYLIEKHLNSNNLPDTMYTLQYNAVTIWDTLSVNTYQYNADNNLEYQEYYSNISSPLMATYRYYYESYNYTPASVNSLSTKAAMVVYPNPTANEITLQWKEGKNVNTTVSLYNMMGQQLMSQPIQWNSTTQQLSLTSFSSGMYLLVVKDAIGNILFNTTVQKQ